MSRYRRVLSSVVAATGLPERLAGLVGGRSLTILVYHGVIRNRLPFDDWCFIAVDSFTEHMYYLSRYFDVLPLGDALQRLHRRELRRPTAAVTFDDGYESIFENAFDILQELTLPATVFLNTHFVDGERTPWFCQLLQILAETRRESVSWKQETYLLHDRRARRRTAERLQARLKELNHDDLVVELRNIAISLDAEKALEEVKDPFRFLRRSSIDEMVRSGLIEFGAHTRTHTILTKVAPARARAEIGQSIEDVSQITGRRCRFFAYPNGRACDYDQHNMEVLKEHGIVAAATTLAGPNTPMTPALELRRYGVGCDDSREQFRKMINPLLARIAT